MTDPAPGTIVRVWTRSLLLPEGSSGGLRRLLRLWRVGHITPIALWPVRDNSGQWRPNLQTILPGESGVHARADADRRRGPDAALWAGVSSRARRRCRAKRRLPPIA